MGKLSNYKSKLNTCDLTLTRSRADNKYAHGEPMTIGNFVIVTSKKNIKNFPRAFMGNN